MGKHSLQVPYVDIQWSIRVEPSSTPPKHRKRSSGERIRAWLSAEKEAKRD